MREHFGITKIRPDSLNGVNRLTTHCWDVLYPIIRAAGQVRKLNYLADGMEAEILHSDGKWYRIEIKPMTAETAHVQ